jgi:type I site-specific restriction endonuclease
MTPEAKARQRIEQRLIDTGWVIQDFKDIDLSAARGVAVREYPTDTGPADYVIFIDREPVGIIEAKRDQAGEHLTAVEEQTLRYAAATLKWCGNTALLPFLFESTGAITRFTDTRDPAPRSREIFHFFRPEQLAAWRDQPDTLRYRLVHALPALLTAYLRACQVVAVTGLEYSLARNLPRALIHMATGAGKTFTAITAIYRLLKFAGAKRVLFLVDTRNLGQQAHQEFMAYTPPDDARTFTFGFFNENIVAEYTYEQSVVDGVNVGYDVFEIETEVTRKGAELKAKAWVDHRERLTRAKRRAQTQEDRPYTGKELDRSVVNPSQIRKVIQEQMKGRGVRSLSHDGLRRVSNSADSAKTRFVLIDAVGVERSLKTDSRPLERKPDVPLKDLLQGVAIGHRDDDTILSLANRLVRLSKQLDAKAQARVEQVSGGLSVADLAKALIAALNPDRIVEAALATAEAKGITRSEDTLTAQEIAAARAERVATASGWTPNCGRFGSRSTSAFRP